MEGPAVVPLPLGPCHPRVRQSRPLGPATYLFYSPHHTKPCNTRNEGSKFVSITWQGVGQAYIARHVIVRN